MTTGEVSEDDGWRLAKRPKTYPNSEDIIKYARYRDITYLLYYIHSNIQDVDIFSSCAVCDTFFYNLS